MCVTFGGYRPCANESVSLLCCLLTAGLTAQAGTFTIVDLPATGTDAAIGISTGKTYTHAFDFGSNAPVTINGVALEQGPTANLTAAYTGTSRQGYGYTINDTRAAVRTSLSMRATTRPPRRMETPPDCCGT